MKFEVTTEDIQAGVRAGCYDCPVARSIERTSGHEAHVFDGTVMLDGSRRRVYRLPDEVAKRIKAYDSGEQMEPFGFEIRRLRH